MSAVIERLAVDLNVAVRCIQAGASVSGMLLYPLRRRGRRARHQIDLRNGTVLVSPRDEPILPMFLRIWGRQVYVPAGYKIEANHVVVDIGANVGLFSAWAASQAPGVHVIAMEPSPRICRYLRENKERNSLANVTVYEAACGAKTGRAILYSHGYETNNSLYGRDIWGDAYEARYEVDVLSLDDVFRNSGIERCDLLKMNCEGGEYDVLFGCSQDTLQRIDRIGMEYHIGRQDRSPQMVAQLLEASGFDVTLLSLHDDEGGYMYGTRPAS